MATISQETHDNLTSVLTLEVSQADYEKKVKQSLNRLAGRVEIKGFRKGKVPAGMVKKMYGTSVLAEEINQLINSEITSFIRENELDILGQPLPLPVEGQELDIQKPSDYVFKYELGHAPQVTIPLLDKKQDFVKYTIGIEDKLVRDEIENIRNRQGNVESIDTGATGNDVIGVTLEELDADGQVKEGGYSHSTSFGIDQLSVKARQTEIKKLKIGESLPAFNLFKSIDKEKSEIRKTLLELPADNALETGDVFKLTLDRINRVIPASLNTDLYDAVYGKDAVKTEEEFEAKVREEIGKYLDGVSENRVKNDIFKHFAEETEVQLPDDFLKRWLVATKEDEVATEDIEHEYAHFAVDLKTSMIFQAIAKEGELKVEPEELQQKIRETLTEQFRYYGMPLTENEEMMQGMMKRFMEDEKQVRQTHDQIMDGKIFEFLKTKVNISDKEVTLDEFNALK